MRVGLLDACVEEHVGGGDANHQFVDAKGAGVREAVDALQAIRACLGVGQLVESGRPKSNGFGAGNVEESGGTVRESVLKGGLRIDPLAGGVFQRRHQDKLGLVVAVRTLLLFKEFFNDQRNVLGKDRLVVYHHGPVHFPVRPWNGRRPRFDRLLPYIHKGSLENDQIGLLVDDDSHEIDKGSVLVAVGRGEGSAGRNNLEGSSFSAGSFVIVAE
mmetsp:Transcript_21956/g.61017  ORF Transcript_21956/g.61017 Transcript_21956/m.61017 type:complete len:215 (-) Transcript_21956:1608-2252(-)